MAQEHCWAILLAAGFYKMDILKYFQFEDVGHRIEDLETPVPVIDSTLANQQFAKNSIARLDRAAAAANVVGTRLVLAKLVRGPSGRHDENEYATVRRCARKLMHERLNGRLNTFAAARDPTIRAEALLRLGRNYRKLGDLTRAIDAFTELVALDDTLAGGLPAEHERHHTRARWARERADRRQPVGAEPER